ncbi:MAG: hypothetical protein ACFCUS_09560 [Rubrimonas sp.]|uniref:hypothetical protein n=1 Tax=Rubrimonas sp. TaxID=2036015 RepID=UPI002FDCD6B8
MFQPIVTFWTGPRVSDLDRLCIASWRALGYEAVVYAYEEVSNLPSGVALRDAETILPRRFLFDDAPTLGPPTRANLFRLALLRAGAGIWLDTDVLLLRPLPQPPDILVSLERGGWLCNGILWARRDFPMMEAVLEAFASRSTPPWSITKVRWRRLRCRLLGTEFTLKDYPKHQWGRHALEYFVRKENVRDQVLSQAAFHHPLVYTDHPFKSPERELLLDNPDVLGVHTFAKGRKLFEQRTADSLVSWAMARYSNFF